MGSIGERVGRYEILDRLSAGGSGEVYVCRASGALGFERLFALKVLRPEAGDRAASRAAFIDEARIVSQLAHPNVASVIDFGIEPDGRLYLVMEFVAGVTLAQLIRAELPLAPGAVALLLAEIAHGLAAAHGARGPDGQALGVVHRDISPQNVMLGFSGEVKIIDFGIALARDRLTPDTVDGGIKGKPRYMAPEQLDGSVIDHRCDLFALGVVGFELLTRRHLFTGRSMTEVLRAVDRCEVDPRRLDAAGAPPALSAIILRCLQRAPEDRFASADELAHALEATAHGLGTNTLRPILRGLLAADASAFEARWAAWIQRATPTIAVRAEGEHTVDARPAPPPPSEDATPLVATAAPARRRAGWGLPLAAAAVASGAVAGGVLYARATTTAASAVLAVPAATSPADHADVADHAIATDPATATTATVAATSSAAAVEARAPEPIEAPAPVEGASPRDRRATRPREGRLAARPSAAAASPSPTTLAAPTPSRRGAVRLVAHPWAYVSIDGGPEQQTPVRATLEVGRHAVVFVDPIDRTVRHRAELDVAEGAEVVVRAPPR